MVDVCGRLRSHYANIDDRTAFVNPQPPLAAPACPSPGNAESRVGDVTTDGTEPGGYTCPGIAMPQPKGAPWEGYVACYRAGHHCPPKVGITTEDETHRTTVYRCPCCGDHGVTFCVPKEWDR